MFQSRLVRLISTGLRIKNFGENRIVIDQARNRMLMQRLAHQTSQVASTASTSP